MKILVTSAGGPAAVGVIKSLYKFDTQSKHYIVATDITENSSGCHLADKYYIVPKSSDDSFITEIRKIIKKEEIDLVLPTGNLEIDKFESLSDITTVFMSDTKTIKLCNDKWEFYNKTKYDFDLPKTVNDRRDAFLNRKLDGIVFAKPRIEMGGSRGALICENFNHTFILEKKCEYIYSDFLPGQEYTIDVLCDMKTPLVAVVRKRLQTKAGVSSKGEIVRDVHIENECKRMCEFLGLKGPVCIQMKEDENGLPKFIEVNPRFGGGTYFTTLAGVNFVKIIISILSGESIFIDEPKQIKVMRYFEEIVI